MILTKCGYRCDLCLAYKGNIEKEDKRQILSDEWYKYFGFRLLAEDICCDGCMAENPHLIDQECPVRPCVIEKGLENCAQCEEYACEKLEQRTVVYERVEQRIAQAISADDRTRFIEPYENKERLDALRAESEED